MFQGENVNLVGKIVNNAAIIGFFFIVLLYVNITSSMTALHTRESLINVCINEYFIIQCKVISVFINTTLLHETNVPEITRAPSLPTLYKQIELTRSRSNPLINNHQSHNNSTIHHMHTTESLSYMNNNELSTTTAAYLNAKSIAASMNEECDEAQAKRPPPPDSNV